MINTPTILAITGGVGGAKLALGLTDEVSAAQLHLLVNTGDDFEHLGLQISPDIDTLLYTYIYRQSNLDSLVLLEYYMHHNNQHLYLAHE